MLRDIDTPLTLLLSLKSKDDGVWRRFVSIYYQPLCDFARSVALRLGVAEADSLDVVQVVLLELANDTAHFEKTRGSFRNWLMMRIRCRIYDVLRSNQARIKRDAEGLARVELINEENQDEESHTLEKALFDRALKTVLETTEARTREAFRRYALENESIQIIAKDLSITPNTIYQIKKRILDRVLDLINRSPFED